MEQSGLQELDVKPDLLISRVLVKPPELVGDGLSAYERYPIVFSQSEPAIPHRYSDFEHLRQCLSRQFPACIVPPLPPRTILKTSISAYFVSDPEFLEARRRGLEEFLNSLLTHKRLSISEELKEFLSIPEPGYISLKSNIADSESWGSKLVSFGWSCGSKLTKTITRTPVLVRKTEEDRRFDELKTDITIWKSHFEQLYQQMEGLVTCAQSLSACFYNIGVPVENMQKVMAAEREELSLDTSEVSGQEIEHAGQLKDVVLTALDKQVRTMEAGIEAIDRREKLALGLQEAYGKLTECKERMVRDKRMGQMVKEEEERVRGLEQELQNTSKELKTEVDSCIETMKNETLRLLKDYTNLQSFHNESMSRKWENASKRLL